MTAGTSSAAARAGHQVKRRAGHRGHKISAVTGASRSAAGRGPRQWLLGLRPSGSRVGAGGCNDGAGFAGEGGVDVAQGADGGGTVGELDEPGRRCPASRS
jgi:hypothetical protein